MSEVQKDAVTLEDVQNMPPVEGEEGTSEETKKPEETSKEPEKKEEVIPKPPVPYDRFEELNKELKDTRREIQELRSKGKEEGLSEEEKRELQAKEYIEKTAREAYQKMLAEEASAEAERERSIGEEVKYFNSIDKDFNEKVAEEIGTRYGTEKNPIPVEVAYNIFQNEKTLKSQIPTVKPKLPAPIRSTDAIEIVEEEKDKGRNIWQVLEDAKNTLRGKK